MDTLVEKKEKNCWIRIKFDLEVISPIHIGTREGKLNALEFFYQDGKVFLIDENKFATYLLKRNLIDLFVSEVSRGPLSMSQFIRDRAKTDPVSIIPQLTSYDISGGSSSMQDFRPFIRDGMGRVFIPGTSFKGAIRTAILYRILKKEERIKKEIINKTEKELDESPRLPEGKKKRFSEKWLQKDLIENYSLPNAKKGPNTDILRCLRIRDAYPIGSIRTQLIPIRFLSRIGEKNFYWRQRKGESPDSEKILEIWVEAIIGGKFSVELEWNQWLFDTFLENNERVLPISGVDDLFLSVEEMNSDIAAHEAEFFQATSKIPPGTTARDLLRTGGSFRSEVDIAAGFLSSWYRSKNKRLFRIGFGSGMLSTTINLALPADLRGKIRDACGHSRPGDPAPKSRRVWCKNENEVLPMGWMRIISKA